MSGALVRTVLGDVPAGELGVTYVHEHLIIDSPIVGERWPHILLPDVESAVAEVNKCVAAGVGTMIDAMPMASGRGPNRLAEISRATGLNIVMATGLHTEKYYSQLPWVAAASVDELADWFTDDIQIGVRFDDHLSDRQERSSHRAGVVKVATDDAGMNARARRLFEAAAMAAQTGTPILTHAEEGKGAMEQLEYLQSVGVDLHRVVVSHTDKVSDSGYHAALLETGANLEFDQALRQQEDSAKGTALLLLRQIEAGFAGQLMLGTDGARRSLWATHNGSPGLAWMAGGYRSILARLGIGEELQHTLFVDNPARVFTLRRPENQSSDVAILIGQEKRERI
jgi:predicted metal-dependent phosphotriesterase family hydrolase